MFRRLKKISKKFSEKNQDNDFSSCEKTFAENDLAMKLFGSFHSHLAKIENKLGSSIYARGNHVTISGSPDAVASTCVVLDALYSRLLKGLSVDIGEVEAAIRMTDISEKNFSLIIVVFVVIYFS